MAPWVTLAVAPRNSGKYRAPSRLERLDYVAAEEPRRVEAHDQQDAFGEMTVKARGAESQTPPRSAPRSSRAVSRPASVAWRNPHSDHIFCFEHQLGGISRAAPGVVIAAADRDRGLREQMKRELVSRIVEIPQSRDRENRGPGPLHERSRPARSPASEPTRSSLKVGSTTCSPTGSSPCTIQVTS